MKVRARHFISPLASATRGSACSARLAVEFAISVGAVPRNSSGLEAHCVFRTSWVIVMTVPSATHCFPVRVFLSNSQFQEFIQLISFPRRRGDSVHSGGASVSLERQMADSAGSPASET